MKYSIKYSVGKKLPVTILLFFSLLFLKCPNQSSPKMLGLLALPQAVNASGLITIAESNGSTSAQEGTVSDTYTIKLESEPTANVLVAIAFDNTQLKINSSITSPAQLNFTSSNWSTAQTVAVEALYDTVTEGTDIKIITHTSTSSDFNYNALAIASVSVSITDIAYSI